MSIFGQFLFGQCKFGTGACPVTNTITITNVSRQRIGIFVEALETSDIAPDLGGPVGLNPGLSITIEDDRVNLGWLQSLVHLGIVRLEFRTSLDPV